MLERLVGRNLQEAIGEGGPLKPERVGRYISQAATALELAHGVGIVHRDLKPANLFLHEVSDEKPSLKVSTSAWSSTRRGPTDRMRDAFGGTPLYMAPEQARGQLRGSARRPTSTRSRTSRSRCSPARRTGPTARPKK